MLDSNQVRTRAGVSRPAGSQGWARALLIAVALTTAACGGSVLDDSTGAENGAPAPAGGGDRPAGTTAAPAGQPSTRPPAAGSPPTTAPEPTTGPQVSAARPVDPAGPVGSLGPVVLDPARRVRVDLLVEEGAAPTDRTVPALRSVLAEVTGKPVAVAGPAAVPPSGGWTAAAIRRAGAERGGPFAPDEAGFRLLFLKGQFADEPSALGVAVDASTAALFTDKIADAAGLLGDRARFEIAVGTHEVGHLLGLVDLVLGAGRGDPEHPGHSRSQNSVMFWAVESDLIGTLLTGGPPTAFDADDRAELEAIRRRGR